jgi:pilus assembly protein CpaB
MLGGTFMRFLKNRTVLGIICIMLALLICFGITPLYNQSISQKATIVRVVKEIGCGEEITKDMVQSVEVGSYNLPEQVVRQS